jgi:hypothetical protein
MQSGCLREEGPDSNQQPFERSRTFERGDKADNLKFLDALDVIDNRVKSALHAVLAGARFSKEIMNPSLGRNAAHESS